MSNHETPEEKSDHLVDAAAAVALIAIAIITFIYWASTT